MSLLDWLAVADKGKVWLTSNPLPDMVQRVVFGIELSRPAMTAPDAMDIQDEVSISPRLNLYLSGLCVLVFHAHTQPHSMLNYEQILLGFIPYPISR